MNTALRAARRIVAKAGEPLHYKEIPGRALAQGYWQTDGSPR